MNPSSEDRHQQNHRFTAAVTPARPSVGTQEGAPSDTTMLQNDHTVQRVSVKPRAPSKDHDFPFSYESLPTKEIPWSAHRSTVSAQNLPLFESDECKKDELSSEGPRSGETEDILDYGMSVEVMEDSRREVILEIKDIKMQNKATQGEIERETAKEKQHKKDLGFAQREIDSLCKGIEVEHERAQTHRSFVNKLQADYDLQIVVPLKQTGDHEYRQVVKGNTLMGRRVKLFKELFEKLRCHESAIRKGSENIEEARDMRRIVLRIIKEHGLEQLLEKARSDAKQFQDDYHENDRYRHKLYNDIGTAKDHLAGLKRETISKRKELKTIQKTKEEWENIESQKLAALFSDIKAAQAKKTEMQSKIESVQAQLSEFEALKREYGVFTEKKQAHKMRMEGLATKETDLKKRKQALLEKIQSAKTRQAETEQRHRDANVALDASKKLLAASELYEKSLVAPAKKELLRIREQKDEILALTKECKEEMEEIQIEGAVRKAALEKQTEKIVADIATAEEKIEELKYEARQMENTHIEAKESLEREISEAKQRRDNMKTILQQTKDTRAADFRQAVLQGAVARVEKSKAA